MDEFDQKNQKQVYFSTLSDSPFSRKLSMGSERMIEYSPRFGMFDRNLDLDKDLKEPSKPPPVQDEIPQNKNCDMDNIENEQEIE